MRLNWSNIGKGLEAIAEQKRKADYRKAVEEYESGFAEPERVAAKPSYFTDFEGVQVDVRPGEDTSQYIPGYDQEYQYRTPKGGLYGTMEEAQAAMPRAPSEEEMSLQRARLAEQYGLTDLAKELRTGVYDLSRAKYYEAEARKTGLETDKEALAAENDAKVRDIFRTYGGMMQSGDADQANEYLNQSLMSLPPDVQSTLYTNMQKGMTAKNLYQSTQFADAMDDALYRGPTAVAEVFSKFTNVPVKAEVGAKGKVTMRVVNPDGSMGDVLFSAKDGTEFGVKASQFRGVAGAASILGKAQEMQKTRLKDLRELHQDLTEQLGKIDTSSLNPAEKSAAKEQLQNQIYDISANIIELRKNALGVISDADRKRDAEEMARYQAEVDARNKAEAELRGETTTSLPEPEGSTGFSRLMDTAGDTANRAIAANRLEFGLDTETGEAVPATNVFAQGLGFFTDEAGPGGAAELRKEAIAAKEWYNSPEADQFLRENADLLNEVAEGRANPILLYRMYNDAKALAAPQGRANGGLVRKYARGGEVSNQERMLQEMYAERERRMRGMQTGGMVRRFADGGMNMDDNEIRRASARAEVRNQRERDAAKRQAATDKRRNEMVSGLKEAGESFSSAMPSAPKASSVDMSYDPIASGAALDYLRRSQVTGYSRGGLAMKDYRKGGNVSGPGTGTSDSIPAYLSDGEYVMNAESMKMPGMPELMEHLNKIGLHKRRAKKS